MNALKLLFSFIISLISLSALGEVKNFGLSASGGVSLGNYQAGRLYYQNQLILENQTIVFPTVFTGASAGSINSLLSIIHLCRKKEVSPDASIYWNLWREIGFNELISGPMKENSALFSDQILLKSAELIRQKWNEGFDSGCVSYLGVPITLKNPDVIKLTPSLYVQRQLVTIILKIKGQGIGKPPLIENVIDPASSFPTSQIYLGNSPKENFDAVMKLLLASGSFPGAFPSQEVRVCLGGTKNCDLESSKLIRFIDGGMYENQPIKLGYQIKDILKRVDPSRAPVHFRHVDASGQGHIENEGNLSTKKEAFLETLLNTFGNFVTTSRNQELYSFIKQNPKAKDEITSTLSMIPKASEPWGAFMGFFDKGFREYDFLLGMYDSYHEFENFNKIRLNTKVIKFQLEDSAITELASWRRFSCLKQFFDEEESKWDQICHDPAVNNLKALTQTSLLRLYHFCKNLSEKDAGWIPCQRFSDISAPPVLTKAYQKKILLPQKEQSSGDYMIKSLESLGYNFDDKEFEKRHPIDQQLRIKLQVLLEKLAERQDPKDRRALKSLGVSALDAFSYLPPEKLLYATLGEVSELGWMTRNLPWNNKYARTSLNLAMEFQKGSDIFSRDSEQLTLAPIIGFSYPLKSSGATLQYQTGLGVGYILPMKNITESRECNSLQKVCNELMLRPYFGVSVLKNIQINFFGRIANGDDGIETDFNVAAGLNYFY